jgi:hypothetical protein
MCSSGSIESVSVSNALLNAIEDRGKYPLARFGIKLNKGASRLLRYQLLSLGIDDLIWHERQYVPDDGCWYKGLQPASPLNCPKIS